MHPAERLVVLGIEVQPAGLQPVGDRDRADRAAGLGKMSATPIVSSMRIELDETALVRPSNAASSRGAGIGGIDDDRRQAARIERGGERQADQPAAEDDHVRAVHRRAP